ncbi:zinc dependent phospholipase C family protein [Bacillus sp. AFS041924]|uniref:zinc dependent phospholipase C family protein n=1 Tax=Bacillus sp. AFS041924 TaxID=2033503 RepID=UPI000BFD5FD3|nr:zinc dependent phospholipase C family protein [Bacillus sp. AFS041924]PGS53923.1 hydrolase [Bacillus sp. AFS041924]
MGSRNMHLIIANQVAKKISISDKSSFLIGGIAPDAVSPKELSHFFIGEANDYTRSIDFDGFLHKYNSIKIEKYILGYYTHLIADDLWLKGFYLPWLKNRIESDHHILNLYHQDFELLNGKLLELYGDKDELKEDLHRRNSILEIHEVSSNDVNNLIPHILKDMNYKEEDVFIDLSVFRLEQIIGYIETCVNKCIMHLKPILNLP